MKKMYKKFFVLIILVTNFKLIAQDFDESFLKSLPPEIRDDILQRKAEGDSISSPQYRRPSTETDEPKNKNDEEFDGKGLDQGDKKLERFGLKIFSMMQSSFMPINEPNFDPSYVLDFGDVIQVQLIGQKSSINKLLVNRDGSVSIPQIGKIFVAGLPLSEASNLIKSKISEAFIGVESFVTLINVRDIQIIVAGNVDNPGSYTLNGNSNIFHALNASGGPSDQGSFRKIDIIRNNKLIRTVDLYKTFIYGETSFNERLRSGDLVFVRPVNNLVTIEGAVKRSGIYEMLNDETLSSAIFFANGLSALADFSEFNLVRIIEGNVIKEKINDVKDLDEIYALDNDSLNIRKFSFRRVSIDGAVKNPGTYLLNEGDGIEELIDNAGGYTEGAYPFGGVLENIATKKANRTAKDNLYADFLDATINLVASSGEGVNFELIELLQEVQSLEINGRVSAEFDIEKLKKNPELDLRLQDGDKVMIPEYLDHVYVFGEVSSEGTARYSPKRDYKYYIDKMGGITPNASKNEIYVLHPNGETFTVGSKNIFKANRSEVIIYPGSIIYIPRKIENLTGLKTTQAYASILSNLGVSIASLAVLKDNN